MKPEWPFDQTPTEMLQWAAQALREGELPAFVSDNIYLYLDPDHRKEASMSPADRRDSMRQRRRLNPNCDNLPPLAPALRRKK